MDGWKYSNPCFGDGWNRQEIGDVVLFQYVKGKVTDLDSKLKVYLFKRPRVDSSGEHSDGGDDENFSDDAAEDESTVDFRSVMGFSSFNISVNNLNIDHEFTNDIRSKYYSLCRSRNSFLHDCVSPLLRYNDEISAYTLQTPRHHIQAWDFTLKVFEDLRARVSKLRDLCLQDILGKKKREFAKSKESLKKLEITLPKLISKIESLGMGDTTTLELRVKAVATSPWSIHRD